MSQHGFSQRVSRRLPGAAALLLLWTAASLAPAADRIEENLPAQAYKALKYLKSQGCENVGVLKFRVKKGNDPETFFAGPLNVALANALENALILMNDKTKPLGIIHDANRVAASKKDKVSYLTAEGCKKLFGYDYPLAWGDKQVQADAFITGLVHIDLDKRLTKITIESLERKGGPRKEISSFEVRTDRSILSDVCATFALDYKKIRTLEPEQQDDQAVDDVKNRLNSPKPTPANRLAELDVYYNNEKQDLEDHWEPGDKNNPEKLDARLRGRHYRVPVPEENARITLGVRNPTNMRVGIVVAVNGINTLHQEELRDRSIESCTKWILDPGKSYELHGFYRDDGKSYLPFKVLSRERSQQVEEQLQTDEWLGAIQMFVFYEGSTEGDPLIRSAGLRRPLKAGSTRPRTAEEAAAWVRRNGSAVRSAGLIFAGDSAKQTEIKSQPFKDPQQIDSQVIWYYQRTAAGKP